ncbi:MAG: ATP-dependent helicase HrpB [Bryobacteraceae bacterium]|nr:ATP-dependent helicase HrpB [Bryobacteraceae bacterium]
MVSPLPVDVQIPEIVARLGEGGNLVLTAPPGSGKTTRVPPALLSLFRGEVLVLEPRRLAARLAARRVAQELKLRLGDLVGYQVRFEDVTGPATRLRYVTEGILARRFLSDPELDGVDCVVVDEFHERHLDADFCLALLRRLQQRRPELRLLVMSGTLAAGPVAQFLGDCPVVQSGGRPFEVSIRYTPASPEPLPDQVAAALGRLLKDGLDGDVLVFLPGAAEIRQAQRACAALAERAGLLVALLHGDLPPEEQDRAVSPAPQRKLILSTNVAESSVTIEGVTAVIDSGLARVASVSPWSGLPVLETRRVSRASADQRAGRAGRTAPGRVIRLYPEADYLRRPAQDTAEILRQDLTEMVLHLAALGLRAEDLEWLDPPPEPSLEAAGALLQRLGAVDARHRLTPEGRRMIHYSLPPRLSKLVIEAEQRGAAGLGCAAAALLSAGQRLPTAGPAGAGESDLEALVESAWSPTARKIYRQLRGERRGAPPRGSSEGFRMAVLAAFPDRVARRRSNDEFLLAGGGSAVLSRDSVVRHAEWLVAVDIEERRERGLPLVRLASAIRPEWLLDLFPERVREVASLEWNRKGERVEAVSALVFQGLVLEESRGAQPDPQAAAQMLAEKAWEAGLDRFVEREELEELLARVSFAAEHGPLRPFTEEDFKQGLARLCQGRRSFGELEAAAARGGFERALLEPWPAGHRRRLEEIAPEKIRLPSGRPLRVRYAQGRTPWVASRLQDFFGMKETPRIAGGKVPLVVHLLAPNQRPVQTTTDLAGFWERLYPQVRRELSRRYPRHAWPERPV